MIIYCVYIIQSNREVFLPLLKQEFLNGYSVIALDYIGFGSSSKPEDFSYDVEDQAQVIIEIIKQTENQDIVYYRA